MKKRFCRLTSLALVFSLLLLLLGGCRSASQDEPDGGQSILEDTPAYRPYVEQPAVRDGGTITADGLTRLELPTEDGTPLDLAGEDIGLSIMSDSTVWMRSRDSDSYCIPLTGGTVANAGKTGFALALSNYAYASDGTLWWCYEDKEEYGCLVKLDHNRREEMVVKRWANTSGFMKAVEKDGTVYVYRVETPSPDKRWYIVEAYDTQTKASTILLKEEVTVVENWENNTGIILYTMAVDGDSFYVLAADLTAPKESHFYISEYALTGEHKADYSLGEAYYDLVGTVYSSPKNMEVVDGYVAIEGLQNSVLLYQLQPGAAKRVYMTESRTDILNGVKGVLYLLGAPASADRQYMVFKIMVGGEGSNYMIVYDREEGEFVSFKRDMGDIYPAMANENLDLLFVENMSDKNLSDVAVYTYNLKDLLKE